MPKTAGKGLTLSKLRKQQAAQHAERKAREAIEKLIAEPPVQNPITAAFQRAMQAS